MDQKLIDFLTELSTNSDLTQAFKKDKVTTMKAAGIDDKHIDLVINKKYDEIQKILGADYDITSNNVIQAFKK